MDKIYTAIDLKSFYASCECVKRGLDPLKTNLVVADKSRTEKTICLAVSPSLKSFKIPGRARLFEVVEKVRKTNEERLLKYHKKVFKKKSVFIDELDEDTELDYLVATPNMQHYMDVSTKVYETYLKYVSKEDIHVYSIDEVFIDLTPYLKIYKMPVHDIVRMMIQDILNNTGITATAGIGTNLFLAKVAMDVVAKHIEPDKDGVRIAYLDEMLFRQKLWNHKPLTDIWRIGPGIAKRLINNGMNTLGDVCRQSLKDEDKLYKIFGINAELLIDHAWGYENVDIKTIKEYKPKATSLSTGQVLDCGYDYKKGLLVVKEMTDLLILDLVSKNLYTDQIGLYIGYDIENINENYKGEIVLDYVGRKVPKPANGTINLKMYNSSTKIIMQAIEVLYKKIVNPKLLIRRINIAATHTVLKTDLKYDGYKQISLFEDPENTIKEEEKLNQFLKQEHSLQKTINNLHKRYGKNSVLKGMNYEDGAKTIERNEQIGGHKK